jgi:predicted enzyme related to lactoylglutathione lyase
MDSVIHFEIPAKDPMRVSSFYKDAFGWQFSQYPGVDYWSIGTTASDQNGMPTAPGAINGGLGRKGRPLDAPTVTIRVEDIDKAVERIKQLGGKLAEKKTKVADMGFTAYFKDTEGNLIGLWQDAKR